MTTSCFENSASYFIKYIIWTFNKSAFHIFFKCYYYIQNYCIINSLVYIFLKIIFSQIQSYPNMLTKSYTKIWFIVHCQFKHGTILPPTLSSYSDCHFSPVDFNFVRFPFSYPQIVFFIFRHCWVNFAPSLSNFPSFVSGHVIVNLWICWIWATWKMSRLRVVIIPHFLSLNWK